MSVIIFTMSNFANAEVRMNAGIGQLSTRSLQVDCCFAMLLSLLLCGMQTFSLSPQPFGELMG